MGGQQPASSVATRKFGVCVVMRRHKVHVLAHQYPSFRELDDHPALSVDLLFMYLFCMLIDSSRHALYVYVHIYVRVCGSSSYLVVLCLVQKRSEQRKNIHSNVLVLAQRKKRAGIAKKALVLSFVSFWKFVFTSVNILSVYWRVYICTPVLNIWKKYVRYSQAHSACGSSWSVLMSLLLKMHACIGYT